MAFKRWLIGINVPKVYKKNISHIITSPRLLTAWVHEIMLLVLTHKIRPGYAFPVAFFVCLFVLVNDGRICSMLSVAWCNMVVQQVVQMPHRYTLGKWINEWHLAKYLWFWWTVQPHTDMCSAAGFTTFSLSIRFSDQSLRIAEEFWFVRIRLIHVSGSIQHNTNADVLGSQEVQQTGQD